MHPDAAIVRGLAEFLVGVIALALLTVALLRAAGVGLGWLPLRAILRAGVQLAVVAAVLRGVLSVPASVAAFVLLMLSTASWTSGGRVRLLYRGRLLAVVAVVTGSLIGIGLVFAVRLVPWETRNLIAVGGILIGNAMSAVTLSGRAFVRASRQRRDELEAWLALGATPRQAHADIGREAVRDALVANLDQTRSTGLVTLPGAFVGALFGGSSPLEAAKFQLAVLVGIGLVMTVAALIVVRIAGDSPILLPAEGGD